MEMAFREIVIDEGPPLGAIACSRRQTLPHGRVSNPSRERWRALGASVLCLAVAGVLSVAIADAQEFPAHHQHLHKWCAGTLTVDAEGIGFAGPKGHAWKWAYRDIQQLTLSPGEIRVLTYNDASRWKLGKDLAYEFRGEFPAESLARQWSATLDQRFVAAIASPPSGAGALATLPAKQLGLTRGDQGTITFTADSVIFDSPRNARTWRYSDIQSISSSSPFQLSITTFEKQFQFQLKGPLNESTYNQLWLEIEKKKRRIQ
jgi:hypothetical protein